MYYVVNKVIISPKIDNYQITVDNIFNSLLDIERYINSMTYIEVDSKTRILHPIETPIGTEIPTENDPDGYYMVKNTQKENRYDIYEKQTKLDKGYIYNSINQTIKKIMFYEINCFDENLFTRKYIFRPNNTTEHRTKNNSLTNRTILSNPKRNSYNGRILAGFCRSSLGKPMSSIDDIGFQRITFLKLSFQEISLIYYFLIPNLLF